MRPVRVSLGDRSYSVAFGDTRRDFGRAFRATGLTPSRVLVVTTRSVAACGHAAPFVSFFQKSGAPVRLVLLPDGEEHKTLRSLEKLYGEALKAGLDRRSLVLAVGGGVVTDLAGFLAATYMRGIALVSAPTTLLGMVDAAIGGKTGVDLPEGKNLVGAFWQPRLVWVDPSVLRTLPARQWRTGFAEIIKYGVIGDARFLGWLAGRFAAKADPRRWSRADLDHAIHVSVRAKAAVVGGDERETPLKGGREILNFGHTIGHALEAAFDYRALSHGEAISIGMLAVGRISLALGLWSRDAQDGLAALFRRAGLPVSPPRLSPARERLFWAALLKDKKHVGGSLRFVLPVRPGRVEVRSGIDPALVKKTLQAG